MRRPFKDLAAGIMAKWSDDTCAVYEAVCKELTGHTHEWLPQCSWVASEGDLLRWNTCATCPDYEITYRKPGPGWWVESNETFIQLFIEKVPR